MEYNVCKTCGAKDGRAGNLITSPAIGAKDECLNCYDTRKTRQIVVHSDLQRTPEELQKTFAILDTIAVQEQAKSSLGLFPIDPD